MKLASSTRIQKRGRECRDFWDLYIGGDRAPPGDVDHRRMEPERETEQHQSITVAWNPSSTHTSARLHSRQKQKERRQNNDYSRPKKERRGCVLLK